VGNLAPTSEEGLADVGAAALYGRGEKGFVFEDTLLGHPLPLERLLMRRDLTLFELAIAAIEMLLS
jgi:hypothetical protein